MRDIQGEIDEALDNAVTNGQSKWLSITPINEIAEDLVDRNQTFEDDEPDELIPYIHDWLQRKGFVK